MTQNQAPELVYLRYHLENNTPVDLLEFTQSLQALQNEYSRFLRDRGATSTKARLNIQKVEEGSIVFELIEALPIAALPGVVHLAGHVNTLVEFGTYLHQMVKALVHSKPVPAEGRNTETLKHLSTFMQPLVNNAGSNLSVEVNAVVNGNIYQQCTFTLDSLEGNALQNQASRISKELAEEVVKTEEYKEKVLLRLERLDREVDSKQDRGVIEAFDPKKPRKLLFDEVTKDRFMESDQNAFKYLYYVDAIALYEQGRIIAYRITKLHEVFDPEA